MNLDLIQTFTFFLVRYSKHSDEWLGETNLNVTAQEVREAFGLAPDEYPGDCFEVTEHQLAWLESSGHKLDLYESAYFVECCGDY